MEQTKPEKKKQDFYNGKIYIIRNTINDLIYIGSTCQTLSKRMGEHRNNMNSKTMGHLKLYEAMRNLGRDNFYIELLEDFKCERREQLRKREGELIREYIAQLNSKIDGRTPKEYYEEHYNQYKEYREKNKEKIKDYKKTHYENNKDKINAKSKIWREANKEQKKEADNKYRENNKEKIKERRKQYREDNKNVISENAKNAREADKDRFKQYNKTYYERHKDIIKAKARELRQLEKEQGDEQQ